MVSLPAFCEHCGSVFPSRFEGAPGAVASFKGTKHQCPTCGRMGHIPDGVFEFTEDAIRLLSGPERTIAELSRFAEILEQAKRKRETPAEVATKIETELPALALVAKRLLVPRTSGDFYSLLTLIATVAALRVAAMQDGAAPPSITVNQTISQVYQQPAPAARAGSSMHRDARCPCGSGKKYKKCCGKGKP